MPLPIPSTELAVRALHLMADGARDEFERVYGPTAVDRDAVRPPAARVPGPAGFWATALWLRAAVGGLRYEVRAAVAEGDLVAVHSAMHGRHTGEWVFSTAEGAVDAVLPPTGRPFVMTESHWFRIEDGRIAEHWADHDALGAARQLGWIPPTPAYLGRMAVARRRAIARAAHG